jgi:ABC-type antimicrobial peptide transport system permease subunit
MALGADDKNILSLIIKKAFILTIIGLVMGLIGSLAICRLMTSLLYSVSVYDPATFVLVPVLLLGVAMLACYFPARKAAHLNPIETLRYE